METLTDKVILITGASRGLGRALALELARRGAQLILNSRSTSAEIWARAASYVALISLSRGVM